MAPQGALTLQKMQALAANLISARARRSDPPALIFLRRERTACADVWPHREFAAVSQSDRALGSRDWRECIALVRITGDSQ